MYLDSRTLAHDAGLETDVCIVGAGPAGLTLCQELAHRGIAALLLESGGLEWNTRLQALNQGTVYGDPYASLAASRYRGVGGTPNLWNTAVGPGLLGAKYLPLDPEDFRGEDGRDGAWPFGAVELEPFYRRARSVCGLGPWPCDGGDRPGGIAHGFDLLGNGLRVGAYQLGPAGRWTAELPSEIRAAEHVTLCTHTTATRLELDGAGARVLRVHTNVTGGRCLCIHPRRVVLAAGAVENARLLLVSGRAPRSAPGGASGWLGRCFMEHPRDYSLILGACTPALMRRAVLFDPHAPAGGTLRAERLAPSAEASSRNRLPNCSITLVPRRRRKWMDRFRARLFAGRPGPESPQAPAPARLPECDGFRVVVNLEQRPDPANRITLDRTTDRLGMPRPALHWRWSAEEQAGLERLRAWLAASFASAGLGRLELRPGARPDPNAHHHAGTTRMHADPARGVVDPDGRVHGIENLFLAGASVFPSAGYANPTLTIVALALRLADHLGAQ